MARRKDIENAKRGDSGLFQSPNGYAPTPLDRDILRILPNEGAMKGRYMRDAMTVKQMIQRLDPALGSSFVSMRMRTMLDEGLVTRMHGSRVATWQRTEKGARLATVLESDREAGDSG